MKMIALTICLLLCVDTTEARQRRKAKRARKHRARVVRVQPCPVCIPPLACPDVVKPMTHDEAAAEHQDQLVKESDADIEVAFQQQFSRWLQQHPEANQSPKMAAVVRDISSRWYRRGREDGRASTKK